MILEKLFFIFIFIHLSSLNTELDLDERRKQKLTTYPSNEFRAGENHQVDGKRTDCVLSDQIPTINMKRASWRTAKTESNHIRIRDEESWYWEFVGISSYV